MAGGAGGRRLGVKNKPNHRAGGRRIGSGRKSRMEIAQARAAERQRQAEADQSEAAVLPGEIEVAYENEVGVAYDNEGDRGDSEDDADETENGKESKEAHQYVNQLIRDRKKDVKLGYFWVKAPEPTVGKSCTIIRDLSMDNV